MTVALPCAARHLQSGQLGPAAGSCTLTTTAVDVVVGGVWKSDGSF